MITIEGDNPLKTGKPVNGRKAMDKNINKTIENDKKEESYGGFQYRHNYDEYKKELARRQQQKCTRRVLTVIIIVSFIVLLGFLSAFIADTVMRTKGYTLAEFLSGTRPVISDHHKNEYGLSDIDALYGECLVTLTADGARSGCGVILTDDGCILAGHDTVSGAASVTVTFPDGSTEEAEVTAYDADKGVALLKVDRDGLVCAEIGDSRALEDGQTVFCKESGKPAAEYSVISASGELTVSLSGDFRTVGAPVINRYGQVVGIVREGDGSTVKASHMDAILKTVKTMLTPGKIHSINVNPTPVYIERLGVYVEPVTEKQADIYKIPTGCFVTSVSPQSQLRRGDIIVSVNGAESKNAEALLSFTGDSRITLSVYRNNSYTEITVK